MKTHRLYLLAFMAFSVFVVILTHHQLPLVPTLALLITASIFSAACSYVIFSGKPRHMFSMMKEGRHYKVLACSRSSEESRIFMWLLYDESIIYCYGNPGEVTEGCVDVVLPGETVVCKKAAIKVFEGDGLFDFFCDEGLYVVRASDNVGGVLTSSPREVPVAVC
jgi:hypothetical protein